MRTLLLSGLALTMFMPGLAHAQVEKYDFDKAHTQILFFVDHLGYTMSQGEFLDYDGGFTFDRDNPENSSVNVTIQTESIDMDDEEWNDHLKNEDFFHVSEYPTMTFESTKITQISPEKGTITGDLTILGETNPVTLNVTFNKAAPFPMGDEYKAGFSATGTLKRSEWGMDYGLPGVGDEVNLRLEVEGVRQSVMESDETTEDNDDADAADDTAEASE